MRLTYSRLLALALALSACGKTGIIDNGANDAAPPDDASPTDGGPTDDGNGVVPVITASKVDLLFAIDNSASMGDKQELLRQAVPDLLQRLVAPNCVDAAGHVLGPSADGTCQNGKIEFTPITDIHVGIVSSSLGGRGADICDGTDPVGQGATRHDDDQGHLLARAGADEHALPDAQPSNFLGWSPVGGAPLLIRDVQDLVNGVHEYGCGIEAQLESWYRFLVQPDPYLQIIPDPADGRRRALSGVDTTILRQRHDFLRPDSLVAIVLISDEDDSAQDPRAVGGQGWAYAMKRFPGSVGGGAARATSACDDPQRVNTADCTSCGFPGHAADPNCQLAGDVDQSTGQPQLGYYLAREDTLNTRAVRMKQRYGVDPQFPIQRYANGLKSAMVPNRDGEVYDGAGSDGKPNNSYNAKNNCTSPLFAQKLPLDSTEELCNLPRGPRSPNLVFFTAITGVPWQMLTQDPTAPSSPFVSTIPTARWPQIIGNNPLAYDLTGIDPHMIQSQKPRAGLPAPTASDTADPYNGREWDTGLIDLQYACTFPLLTPKDCKDPKFSGACDCASGTPPLPPLCDATTPSMQVRGKAYPGLRELTLAHEMGAQGVVGSLCPRSNDTGNEDFGYRPAVRALVDHFHGNLK